MDPVTRVMAIRSSERRAAKKREAELVRVLRQVADAINNKSLGDIRRGPGAFTHGNDPAVYLLAYIEKVLETEVKDVPKADDD